MLPVLRGRMHDDQMNVFGDLFCLSGLPYLSHHEKSEHISYWHTVPPNPNHLKHL